MVGVRVRNLERAITTFAQLNGPAKASCVSRHAAGHRPALAGVRRGRYDGRCTTGQPRRARSATSTPTPSWGPQTSKTRANSFVMASSLDRLARVGRQADKDVRRHDPPPQPAVRPRRAQVPARTPKHHPGAGPPSCHRPRWAAGRSGADPVRPLPHPGETLPGYVERVAAATGTHRHRAMELLGLAPGTSATQRLTDLTRGQLPDDAVHALVAATGMTPAQARALATTASAAELSEEEEQRLLEA
ncbi:TniQ family protein, partial [Streptomyces sp. NPDC002586]